jgi:hypothetical protein
MAAPVLAQLDYLTGMVMLSATFDHDLISQTKVIERTIAYHHLLFDVEGEIFLAACWNAARSERAFPSPAALRGWVDALTLRPDTVRVDAERTRQTAKDIRERLDREREGSAG